MFLNNSHKSLAAMTPPDQILHFKNR